METSERSFLVTNSENTQKVMNTLTALSQILRCFSVGLCETVQIN